MIVVRRATSTDAAQVADVYLASFRAALPTVRLAHSDDEVRAYIRDQLIPTREAWVALDGEEVVGMLSLSPGWIESLYVAPLRLSEGIGTRLLDVAKQRAAGSLDLWAFQINQRARRFYEHHGFVMVEMTDGARNEEHEPDVRYRWEPGG